MATEVKLPDAILASTNLSGTVAAIDEDPSSPDSNWLTATSATSSTSVRVSFPTPTGSPTGSQDFNCYLRKTAGTPDPTVDVTLYQGGTPVLTLSDDVAITSTTGQLVTSNWDASYLTGTTDGSDVEAEIVSTAGVGNPSPGAVPAYSSVGTATHIATLPGTNSIAVPAHSSGDLLLLHILARNGNNDGTLSSINTAGWTQGGGAGTMYGGAVNARTGFGWKIGNGTETTVSITTSGGTSTDRLVARVYRFTAANGFDATSPVENIGTATSSNNTATLSMPTVNPGGTAQNKLAVCLVGISFTSTVPSATGESGGDWVAQGSPATGTNGCIAIQTASVATGSTISGGSATITSGSSVSAIGFTLKPASTPGSAVNTVEIGAIGWSVNYTASGTTYTASSNADSAVLLVRNVSSSADSSVLAERNVSSSLDGAALTTPNVSASFDSRVLATIQAQTSADAAVLSVRDINAGADFAISADGGATTGLDIGVAVESAASCSLEATVETSRQVTLDADGVASVLGQASVSCDVAVLTSVDTSSDLDAVIALPSPTAETSFDVGVQDTISDPCVLDVAAYFLASAATDFDLGVAVEQSVSIDVDVAVALTQVASTDVDVFVYKDAETLPVLLDTAISLNDINASLYLDVAAYVENSITCDLDLSIATEGAALCDADSIVELQGALLVSLDASVEDTLLASTEADVSVVTELAGVSTATRRASVQAYSGGASSVVARIDASPSLSNMDRAHVTEIYRGVAPQASVLQVSTHFDVAATTSRTRPCSFDTSIQNAFNITSALDSATQATFNVSCGFDSCVESSIAQQTQYDSAVAVEASNSTAFDLSPQVIGLIASTDFDLSVSGGASAVVTEADTLVQDAISLQTTADTSVAVTFTVSANADAVAEATQQAFVDAQSAIQDQIDAQSSFDIVISDIGAVSTLAQGAVEATRLVSANADVPVALNESATTIQNNADAVVGRTINVSATSEALVQSDVFVSTSFDASLIEQVPGSIFSTFDIAAQDTASAQTSADVAASTTFSASTSADASVINQIAGMALVAMESAIEARIDSSLQADLAVGLFGEVSVPADAVALISQSLDLPLDGAVMASGALVAADADVVALAAKDASVGLESALQAKFLSQANLDLGVAYSYTVQTSADAATARVPEVSIPADSAIEGTRTAEVGLDLLIQTSGILAVLEGAVQVGKSLSTSVDGVSAIIGNAPILAECAVLGNISSSIVLQGLVEAKDLSRSTSFDIGVAETATPILVSVDAVVEASRSADCGIDGVAERQNISASLELDVVAAYEGVESVDADSVALASLAVAATADVAVEVQDYILGVSLDTLVYNYNPFLPAPRGEYSVFSLPENRGISGVVESYVTRGGAPERTSVAIAAEKRGISGIPAENRTVGR